MAQEQNIPESLQGEEFQFWVQRALDQALVKELETRGKAILLNAWRRSLCEWLKEAIKVSQKAVLEKLQKREPTPDTVFGIFHYEISGDNNPLKALVREKIENLLNSGQETVDLKTVE